MTRCWQLTSDSTQRPQLHDLWKTLIITAAHTMSFISAFFSTPPDPAARRPLTTAAFVVPYSLHYVLAVLAILPHTFILKVSLFPIVLWQAWKCAVERDVSVALANSLGFENSARFRHLNLALVGWLFGVVLRSLAWTIAKEPLRRYNPPVEGQRAAPIERPLTIPNVLLDALDLMFNLRGIGWSWSYKPFPETSTWSTSIPAILTKLLLKFVVFDISHYLMQRIRPSVNDPAGGTIFDSTLSTIPRFALAAFCTVCGAVVAYTALDMSYHISALIGRILLRQPAWRWPPLFERPWASTSVADFWRFRWHQMHRYAFVVLGSQPVGAKLGRPGALLGAFAVSGVLHDFATWGLGKGMEFRSVSGFFLLMGVGAALECWFKQATGHRVGGLWGWVWCMVWSIGWGTMIIDAWTRRGLMASDFFPLGPRPGKWLVDTIISL